MGVSKHHHSLTVRKKLGDQMASLVAFIALAGVGLSAGVTVISVVQHSRERRQQQLKEYRKSLCRH